MRILSLNPSSVTYYLEGLSNLLEYLDFLTCKMEKITVPIVINL